MCSLNLLSFSARDLAFVMNFSLRNRRRKWSCRGLMSASPAMVTVALSVLLAQLAPADARKINSPPDLSGRGGRKLGVQMQPIPLPRARPAEAPKAVPDAAAAGEKRDESAGQPARTEPQPSACRLALTENVAIAPSIPDIRGPGACGGEDLVRLDAIVLPDTHEVSVKPSAVLRCSMASELADWVRSDMAPLATSLGTTIRELDNFDSYECRGRNRVPGAKLSEHGRANAIDVRAFKLADGQSISLTDRDVPRAVRERALQSACARFTTVLGPGSDGYHEDHIHLDLAQRHNGYRICQWDVWDPLPKIAPLLPAERPEGAPPRKLAARSGPAQNDGEEQERAGPGAVPADKPEAESTQTQPRQEPIGKRRAKKRR